MQKCKTNNLYHTHRGGDTKILSETPSRQDCKTKVLDRKKKNTTTRLNKVGHIDGYKLQKSNKRQRRPTNRKTTHTELNDTQEEPRVRRSQVKQRPATNQ